MEAFSSLPPHKPDLGAMFSSQGPKAIYYQIVKSFTSLPWGVYCYTFQRTLGTSCKQMIKDHEGHCIDKEAPETPPLLLRASASCCSQTVLNPSPLCEYASN